MISKRVLGRACVDQIFTLKQIGEKSKGCMWEWHMIRLVGRPCCSCWECMMWVLNFWLGLSVFFNSLACERVKWGKCFRIESGVRRGCYVSLAFQFVYGCTDERGENGMGRMRVRFLKVGRECRLPGLLYTMIWFCVVSWKKTWRWWRCVEEEVWKSMQIRTRWWC